MYVCKCEEKYTGGRQQARGASNEAACPSSDDCTAKLKEITHLEVYYHPFELDYWEGEGVLEVVGALEGEASLVASGLPAVIKPAFDERSV